MQEGWWKITISTEAMITFQAIPTAPGVDPRHGQRQQIVRAIFKLYLPAIDHSDACYLVPDVLMCQKESTLIEGAQICPISRGMPPSKSLLRGLELLDPDQFLELEAEPISQQ